MRKINFVFWYDCSGMVLSNIRYETEYNIYKKVYSSSQVEIYSTPQLQKQIGHIACTLPETSPYYNMFLLSSKLWSKQGRGGELRKLLSRSQKIFLGHQLIQSILHYYGA